MPAVATPSTSHLSDTGAYIQHVEPQDAVFETMTARNVDSVPRSTTLVRPLPRDSPYYSPTPQVTELAKDDASTQAGNPVVTQDFSDPTIENSNWCSDSPGVKKDAYIQSSASLDVITTPLMLVEDGLTSSGGSGLESPMDIHPDHAVVHSELETDSGCGFDTTHRTIAESISQLLYTIAFSRLSCPPHTSPPAAPNSSFSEVSYAPSPSQIDLSVSYAGDSLNEPLNPSSSFAEPASTAFVRPASPLPPSSPGFINDYAMEFSDCALIPPFPSLSSPASSPSPPNFFTSSPSRHALHKSPPTSPVSTEELTAVPSAVYFNPLKRRHSPETVATFTNDHDEDSAEEPTKKVRQTHDTGFVVLTVSLEVECIQSPSAQAEHTSFPTSRTREAQDAISVTRDGCDEGLPSI